MGKDKVSHAYTPIAVNTGCKLVVIDTGLGLGLCAEQRRVGQYHSNLQLRHRPQRRRRRDHLPLPWRSHQRPGQRQQAGVPECRGDGTRDRVEPSDATKARQAARRRGKAKCQVKACSTARQQGTQYQPARSWCRASPSLCKPGPHAGPCLAYGHVGQRQGAGAGRRHRGRRSLFADNPDWQFVFDTDKAWRWKRATQVLRHAAAEKMLVQGFTPFPSLGPRRKERQWLPAGAGAMEPQHLGGNLGQKQAARPSGPAFLRGNASFGLHGNMAFGCRAATKPE